MNNYTTYKIKNNFLVLFLFIVLITTSLSAQTKMQSGSWSVSPSLEDYSLDSNNGERSVSIEINFPESFKEKPEIFLSVSQIDVFNKTNTRFNVEAISISRDGFTLIVKTWSDSKIFSISGNWIAHSN